MSLSLIKTLGSYCTARVFHASVIAQKNLETIRNEQSKRSKESKQKSIKNIHILTTPIFHVAIFR